MKRSRRGVLITVALFAFAVGVIDTCGWWWWNRATRLLAIDSENGARLLAEQALFGLPSVVDRSRRLAVGDLGAGPIDLAVAVLVRCGNLQCRWMPAHPVGATNVARAHLIAGEVTEAVPVLEQALIRDPTSAYLHRLRALISMSRGDLDGALEDLAVALALAPELTKPDLELPPESQPTVRLRSLELRREFYPRKRTETALALARELRRGGDDDGARAVLREHEGHPEVLLERATWAVAEGDAATAVELLGFVTDRPSVPRRYRARAWSIMALARDLEGDHDGALEAAGRALSLDQNSTYAFVSLAGLAEREGNYDRALEYLRRAWGMAPSDVSLLIRIARVAEKAGKGPDALLAMERAVDIDPSSPELTVQLVSLQLRMGKFSEAAVALSRALDRHPTNPALLELAERLRRDVGIR